MPSRVSPASVVVSHSAAQTVPAALCARCIQLKLVIGLPMLAFGLMTFAAASDSGNACPFAQISSLGTARKGLPTSFRTLAAGDLLLYVLAMLLRSETWIASDPVHSRY